MTEVLNCDCAAKVWIYILQSYSLAFKNIVDCIWNVMTHAQKPDFVFRRNGRVYLSWLERQFSRLLAAEVCASAVVMLDTPCSEILWRVLANHSVRQFSLHFPSRALPCVITFRLDSTQPLLGTGVSFWWIIILCLTFRRRIKSRLPFAGIIRRLTYSTRFQDKG